MSTTSAPTVAHDYAAEATARAAAKAGMSVEAWERYCDALETREKQLSAFDRQMRQRPHYRGGRA